MVLLVGLFILAALAVFAVENWSPAVPLVILGAQTSALPLALWVIGAVLAGALTVLAIAVLLQPITSSGRPPRGRRYANEDRARQRYVVEDPFPDDDPERRSPRTSRTNPYVDEVDDRGDAGYGNAGYGDTGYGDAGYDDGRDYGEDYEDAGDYGSYGAGSSYRTATRDDWDSFSQPRRDWADWDANARRQPSSRDTRDVDQVLDVNPVGAGPSVDEVDLENEADWQNWSDYEEPTPAYTARDRTVYPPDDRPRRESEYPPPADEPRWAGGEADSYTDDYGDDYSNDYGDSYASDYGPAAYANPTDEPRYATDYGTDPVADTAYEAPTDYGGPFDADAATPLVEGYGDRPDDYEDYIIDYGDETEIDQFKPPQARRGWTAATPTEERGANVSNIDDDEDWSDWDIDADTEDPSTAANVPPTRDIYEVPAEPTAVSRSGSIYSYRYRGSEPQDEAEDEASEADVGRDQAAAAPEEPSRDSVPESVGTAPDTEPDKAPETDPKTDSDDTGGDAATSPEPDSDTNGTQGRILTPPYRPDSTDSDSTP